MKKIILIDNYDSFTFNLYHYLSSLEVSVDVIRNDQISSKEIFPFPHKGSANFFLINFLAIDPYLKLHALV